MSKIEAAASARTAYPDWQIALSFGLGWSFVIVGLAGLVFTPFLIWQTRAFVAHAVHAQASVVDFKSYPAERGQSHRTYRPIVEVVDDSGGSARVLVGAATYPKAYEKGDRVDVLYPPGVPSGAVLNDTEDVWGTTIGAGIVFPSMLLLGIVVMVWMRYFVKHPPERLVWLDRWSVPLRLFSRWITG